MLRKAIVTLLLAGLATVAVAENVYKWSDAQGQIHYTDRPPTDARATIIEVLEKGVVEEGDTTTDAADATDAADETTPPEDSGSPPAGDSTEAAAAVRRDVQKARVEQCKQAQDRYKTYISSQRLFRETADGKREYLTDEELAAARIQAKQAISEFCD
jgi:hypothetical protein